MCRIQWPCFRHKEPQIFYRSKLQNIKFSNRTDWIECGAHKLKGIVIPYALYNQMQSTKWMRWIEFERFLWVWGICAWRKQNSTAKRDENPIWIFDKMANSHAWDEKLKSLQKMCMPNETKLKPNPTSWDGKQCDICVRGFFSHVCYLICECACGDREIVQKLEHKAKWEVMYVARCDYVIISKWCMQKSPWDIKLVNSEKKPRRKMQSNDYLVNYFDSQETANFQREFEQICGIIAHFLVYEYGAL